MIASVPFVFRTFNILNHRELNVATNGRLPASPKIVRSLCCISLAALSAKKTFIL
jgi:hypothetical protein